MIEQEMQILHHFFISIYSISEERDFQSESDLILWNSILRIFRVVWVITGCGTETRILRTQFVTLSEIYFDLTGLLRLFQQNLEKTSRALYKQ